MCPGGCDGATLPGAVGRESLGKVMKQETTLLSGALLSSGEWIDLNSLINVRWVCVVT